MTFFFFTCLVLSSLVDVQAISTEVVTIEIYHRASFHCEVTDVAALTWQVSKRDTPADSNFISQRNAPYHPEKHSLIINGGNVTLVVLNATEEDEGVYTCQDGGVDKAKGELKIEIPPKVHLMMNGVIFTDVTDVEFLKDVSIQCVAEGGKPSVSLSWLVNGESKTSGVTPDLSQEQQRTIISTIAYIPNKADTNLTCVTSGQEIVPSISVSVDVNVMYKPDCILLVTNKTTNQFQLSCKCSANPEASEYKIFVNGSLYREQMDVLISSNDTSVVACSASNVIGEDKTEEQTLEPFHVPQPPSTTGVALKVAIPAAIICVSILAVLAVVYSRARKNKENKEETEKSLHAVNANPPPPEDKEEDIQKPTGNNATPHSDPSPDVNEENAQETTPLNEQKETNTAVIPKETNTSVTATPHTDPSPDVNEEDAQEETPLNDQKETNTSVTAANANALPPEDKEEDIKETTPMQPSEIKGEEV